MALRFLILGTGLIFVLYVTKGYAWTLRFSALELIRVQVFNIVLQFDQLYCDHRPILDIRVGESG